MKTDFILAALMGALAIVGCRQEAAKPDARHDTASSFEVVNHGYRMMDIYDSTVDGCHYLTTSRGGIVHKANCTNHVADLKLWQMQNAIAP